MIPKKPALGLDRASRMFPTCAIDNGRTREHPSAQVGCFRLAPLTMAELGNTRVLLVDAGLRKSLRIVDDFGQPKALRDSVHFFLAIRIGLISDMSCKLICVI